MDDSPLEGALEQFEAVEANLHRLEAVANEMADLTPGAYIDTSSPEKRRHDDLVRSFNSLLAGLPPIGGLTIEPVDLSYTEIGRIRVELLELGEPMADLDFSEQVNKPQVQVDDYRHRFNQSRAKVVRDRVQELAGEIDAILPGLVEHWEYGSQVVDDERFFRVGECFAEISRLLGSAVPRRARWSDLSRHLSFGQAGDLHDIANMDWPSVRSELRDAIYGDDDPIPVDVADLADLVKSRPSGSVSTALRWDLLSSEDFERLVFNLLLDTPGCENVDWLMHPNAPDQGRDISATLVIEEGLSGIRHERVMVQCKHWRSKPVGATDVAALLASLELWEPPPIHLVIIATSGRFSADAVRWIEGHNHAGKRPRIDPWPESHLETLLAVRPHLVAKFGLRE